MNYRDIIRGVREDRDDTQARIGNEGTHPPARPVDVCLFYFRIHSVLPQPSVGCVDRLPCPAISSRHFTG